MLVFEYDFQYWLQFQTSFFKACSINCHSYPIVPLSIDTICVLPDTHYVDDGWGFAVMNLNDMMSITIKKPHFLPTRHVPVPIHPVAGAMASANDVRLRSKMRRVIINIMRLLLE